VLFALVAPRVFAQWSGSAIAVSDYRYRGVSLSRDRPALQASATWDDASGLYGGAFASTVQFPHRALSAQVVAFAGYAARVSGDLSLDVGGEYAAFAGSTDYGYAEAFAGVTWTVLTARVHYAPRYFGIPGDSWYVELDAVQPLSDRLTLAAHAGRLFTGRSSGAYYPSVGMYSPSGADPVDVRIALAADIGGFNVQLGWVASTHPEAAYPFYENARKRTVVVSASHAF
jgi:uncharacterized protein (TIGR02001 family)